jgi:hypothetical protein
MKRKDETLYSLTVSVAELLKWLDRFMILAIGDELMHLTTCNSTIHTYLMVINLPHMWIFAIERQSDRSLYFKPKMGFFCGLCSTLMTAAFE